MVVVVDATARAVAGPAPSTSGGSSGVTSVIGMVGGAVVSGASVGGGGAAVVGVVAGGGGGAVVGATVGGAAVVVVVSGWVVVGARVVVVVVVVVVVGAATPIVTEASTAHLVPVAGSDWQAHTEWSPGLASAGIRKVTLQLPEPVATALPRSEQPGPFQHSSTGRPAAKPSPVAWTDVSGRPPAGARLMPAATAGRAADAIARPVTAPRTPRVPRMTMKLLVTAHLRSGKSTWTKGFINPPRDTADHDTNRCVGGPQRLTWL